VRRRILVIFEQDRPSEKAIQYAGALARRMDGDLVLLRLGGEPAPGDEARKIARNLSGSGIATGYEARDGDPRSELLKFLATNPTFLAVVWGGHDDVVMDPGRPRAHWLAPMQEGLGCPLITMHRKAEA
jgi:hypothetical protein